MAQPINILQANIQRHPLQAAIVCSDVCNPRGLAFDSQGKLLLIEAGAGEYKPPFSGRLTIRDRHTGEIQSTLLKNYRALNMQQRMRRDEIMGLADIAPTSAHLTENQRWMVSFTDYIDGSKIIEVDTTQHLTVFETRGNINSICYHPQHQAWYVIKPDTNEVLQFKRNRPEQVICKLPDLASGQEAVPVNVICEPASGNLLITLFSGELGRSGEYQGIDFSKGEGAVIAVDPDSGAITTLVAGLTLPTALCWQADKGLLVTELCDDFLEPLPTDHIPEKPLHGGFKRFSGRLLRIDLNTRQVWELATGLDTPSNMALYDGAVYVSEGMGLPGRPILQSGVETTLRGYVKRYC